MKIYKVLAILLAGILCFGQTVEEIMDKVDAASGTKAAAEHIQSMMVKGSVNSSMGMQGSFDMLSKNGGKMLLNTKIKAQGMELEQVQACDGTDCYSKDPMMGARLLEGQEKELFLLQNDYLQSQDWRTVYPVRRYEGEEELDGTKVYKVYLETKEGTTFTNFIDQKTYLVIKSEFKMKGPMGELMISSKLMDYKDVSHGLMLPMKVETSTMGQSMSMTMDEVKVNLEIPESKFAIPAELKGS